MKYFCILAIILFSTLLTLKTQAVIITYPEVFARCDYCNSENDYRTIAEATMIAGPTGTYTVSIINTHNIDVWHAQVEVTGDMSGQQWELDLLEVNVISIQRASQEKVNEVKTVSELTKAIPVIDLNEIDPNVASQIVSECGTATGGACATLTNYLRQLPASQAYINASWARKAWRSLFSSSKLQYLVIFQNGSIEEWKSVFDFSGAAGFYPEENTTADQNGSATGGGTLDGYDDVGPGGEFLSNNPIQSCDYWLFVFRINGVIQSMRVECI